jgi:hypothetical protein
MNLYKEFFYKISYGMDNVTDSQPNYLQIDIYANPDLYLREYSVEDILGDSSQEQLILHLKSYIDLDRKVREHWTINTKTTQSPVDFFLEKKNEKDYGYIFSKKHLKSPINNLDEILDIVIKDYQNQKVQEMPHYLVRKYHAQKSVIADHLKKIHNSLEKSLLDKTAKYIKTNGLIGIDIPIEYKKEKDDYFSVPFYLATPEYISKLKLNKSLNESLQEKPKKSLKVKI